MGGPVIARPVNGSGGASATEPMSVMPAAADLMSRNEAISDVERALMSAAERNRTDQIHIASTLVLDGEQVARSVQSVNRAEAARSFSALPAF